MLTARLQNSMPGTVLFTFDLGETRPGLQTSIPVSHEVVRSGQARAFLREAVLHLTTSALKAKKSNAELLAQIERIVTEEFDRVMDELEGTPTV